WRSTPRSSEHMGEGRRDGTRGPPANRPGCRRPPLRAADALLAGFLEELAERLLLLRAVLVGLRAAERRGVESEAPGVRAVGDRPGGDRVRPRRLGRVPQPRPLLERPGDQVERIPHLLPG